MPDDFDLDAYLARIGYGGPVRPDLATLTALHVAHVAAIPFESLDPLTGRPVKLDLASLQAKMVQGRRGGYCFEQNHLFRAALEEIGFSVTGLGGRVVWMSPPGAPLGARGHMLLKVDIAGRPYLADVGFGAHLLDAPLRLEEGPEQATPAATYRLQREGDLIALAVRQGEAWRRAYVFDLIPQLPSDYAVANRRVAEVIAAHPDRLIGFAFVNARADQGQVGDLLETAVRRYGFRGIKIHQHDGRITREVCEVARRLRLPILYDVMGETTTVDLVAAAYPDVSFIVPHLGSFGDDYRAQVATIDLLVRFPNVYADTSGVRRFDLLEQAVRRAGAAKILFGTDGPWLHPAVEIAKIHALGLRPEAARKVLGGNILRLLGPERAVSTLFSPSPEGSVNPPAAPASVAAPGP